MKNVLLGLIDPKILAILKLFLKNPDQLYHLKKISLEAKVPLGTTFRLINKLTKLQILSITTVGKLKLYRLNRNEQTKVLEGALK